MEIKDFLKLNDSKQKEYILSLNDEEFSTFNNQLKRKNMRLSMSLASYKQSNKNIKSNLQSKNDVSLEADIYEILPNPEQPRKKVTEEEIVEKMESIKERGLITPITVTKKDNQIYLVAGQVRLAAFKRLFEEENLEKFKKIPVSFRVGQGDFTNEDFAIDSLIENLNRSDMSVIDTANAIKRAIDNDGVTVEKLGKVVGKSKFYISSHLRIAKAPVEIIDFIETNNVSNPTVIYEVLKLDLSVNESVKVLQDYIDGKLKRSDIIKLKNQDVNLEKNKDINKVVKKKLTPYEDIFNFKKKFDYRKFESLELEDKKEASRKLEEIKKLQEEVLELIK